MLKARFATHSVCELKKKLAKIAGNVNNAWAKIKGIIPAMFTRNGKVPLTGIDMRLPTLRPGYITGTLRCPCWTNTIAKIVRVVKTKRNQSRKPDRYVRSPGHISHDFRKGEELVKAEIDREVQAEVEECEQPDHPPEPNENGPAHDLPQGSDGQREYQDLQAPTTATV